jgi:hypothetical protein
MLPFNRRTNHALIAIKLLRFLSAFLDLSQKLVTWLEPLGPHSAALKSRRSLNCLCSARSRSSASRAGFSPSLYRMIPSNPIGS